MSIKKKLLCVACSLVLAFSFSGCSNTTWVNKVDNKEINAGIYLYYMTEGYNNALSTLQKSDTTVNEDNIMSKQMENKDMPTYLKDYATEHCKRFVAIENQFKELKLSFSEKQIKNISKTTSDAWANNEKIFEHMGISQSSLKKILQNQQKETLVFEKYYHKGGIEAVSDNDFKAEIEKSYTRVKLLPIILKADDGTAFTTEQKANALKEAEDYVDKINKGEDFDEMIDKYYQERYGNSKLDTSVDSNDQFRNEQILYDGYQYIDSNDLTKLRAIDKMNEPMVLKGEEYYYVVEKLDILARDDLLNDLYDSAIKKMKSDDFESKIKEWTSKFTYEENKEATERYSASAVIKRYVEFNKNNSSTTDKATNQATNQAN